MKITRLAFTFCVATLLTACSDLDQQGRLPVEKLTSASGSLNFSAMVHSDSASVLNFKPNVFSYKGEPYTGAVVQYYNDTLALISGYLSNGLMDSNWTYRFKTGGVSMEGKLKDGYETGLWRSYYGYDKPKVEKLYDEAGFMLMRKEYYDNGRIKNYQNIKSPLFGDRDRKITFSRSGQVESMYVEDSILQLSPDELTEKVGENMFMKRIY